MAYAFIAEFIFTPISRVTGISSGYAFSMTVNWLEAALQVMENGEKFVPATVTSALRVLEPINGDDPKVAQCVVVTGTMDMIEFYSESEYQVAVQHVVERCKTLSGCNTVRVIYFEGPTQVF